MIRIEPAGAEALLLTLAEEPEVDLSVRLAELARRLREGLGEGVRDLVPGWTTLMLHYDPYRIAPQILEERLGPLLAEWHAWRPAEDAGRLHEIPVWYAGEDLATVAVACGLTGEGVIELHSAAEYRVGAIGFAPGFAYLGGLDPRLVLPRRATPRARVPAGSLAIAEAQTAIYPQASPGGWHLLGRSPWRPFDPAVTPPCPLALGDRVRFVAIGREAFLDLGGRECLPWSRFRVRRGQRIELGFAEAGQRAYLACAGGFRARPVLGSVACQVRDGLGGLQGDGRILAEGDCLPCAEAGAACPWDASVPWRFQPDYRQQRPLRVLFGGDAAAFDAASRQAFFASAWRISPRSDRMGVRLAGKPLRGAPRAWSQGVVEGAIQVPPDGQPIVLMADRQSMGGYPLLGFVHPLDLSRLAQSPAHSEVTFVESDLATQQADLLRFYRFFRG
ncbi:5-oxoprolinase subunit PxpB [Pseudomonas aeruginosa]